MLRRDDQLAAELHPSRHACLLTGEQSAENAWGFRESVIPEFVCSSSSNRRFVTQRIPRNLGRATRRTYRIWWFEMSVRSLRIFTDRKHKKGTDKWYDQSADCLPIRKKVEVAPKSDTRIKKSAGPVTDKRLGYARFPVP